jgi:hypothetical protein
MVGEEEKRREPRRWTAERRAVFLETLAATCCVAKAAEAVGATPSTAYSLKLRDAEFAAQWQEAIAIGYAQVEERLILDAMGRAANDREGHGTDGGDGVRMDKYEREQALNLLKWHRAEATGMARRGGKLRCAEQDETDAAILARLAAVRKRIRR